MIRHTTTVRRPGSGKALSRTFLLSLLLLAAGLLPGAESRAQIPIAIGPQTSTFSTWVRGYHFTAPTNFTICGLFIPTDAGTGNQSVAVVRFTAGAPPAFPGVTNSFVSLFYSPNNPTTGIIPCSIPVNAGDVIGVYGARGANQDNSYDGVNYVTTIGGMPTTLSRSGMQNSLATMNMMDIWSEVSFSIGRIIMYTNCCDAATPTVVSPVNYCQGDPSSPLTASGNAGGYRWYTAATGGTALPGAPVPSTATPGTTTYYVAGIGATPAGCESDRVPVVVNVTVRPAAPTITGRVQYCAGETYQGVTVNGPDPLWYTQASGGTGSATAPVINTTTPGTYNFWVTQTVSGCESPRTPVVFTVLPFVSADFNFDIRYGCGADTVIFTNNSVGGGDYLWNFGDGQSATDTHAVHVYTSQNIFNVQLRNIGGFCRDSVTKAVDLVHPLDAQFTVDDDSVCGRQPIQFTSTSVTTTRNGIDPRYLWIFDDGTTDTGAAPIHVFANSGIYNVRLVVTDFVPCTDTAYHVVVVDSVPYVQFSVSDSALCEGKAITMRADYLQLGNTGIHWDFGDGLTESDADVVVHSYEPPGTYTVKLTASYRICDDVDSSRNLVIRPFPSINIGPDTVLCPQGAPILMADLNDGASNPASRYRWSTGDTTGQILARNAGVYWATISLDGCTATDSAEVFKDCYLDIPNAFTPDGDGVNDNFLPRQLLSRSVTKFSMAIYNRWGQLLFETRSINGRGWDGRFNGELQPGGVYIYVIDATFGSGESEHYTGNVTLMR